MVAINLDQLAKKREVTVLGLCVMSVKFSFQDCNSVLAPVPEDFTQEEARFIEDSAPGTMKLAVKLVAAAIQNGLCRI